MLVLLKIIVYVKVKSKERAEICLMMELSEDEARMQMLPENHSMDVTFLDQVAVIEINHGENRLNHEFIQSFHRALDKVEA